MSERMWRRITSVSDGWMDENLSDRHRLTPETDLQALMEAAPFDDPAVSSERKQIVLEPLRDAIEGGVLDEREQWVIEATFWRGMGVRAIGKELGLSKTYVHKLRHQAFAKLRVALVSAFADELGLDDDYQARLARPCTDWTEPTLFDVETL